MLIHNGNKIYKRERERDGIHITIMRNSCEGTINIIYAWKLCEPFTFGFLVLLVLCRHTDFPFGTHGGGIKRKIDPN